MHYFVLKSGTELFDLSLAYGLAGVIQAGAEDMDVRLSDQGSHYLISAPPPKKLNAMSFLGISTDAEMWKGVFFSEPPKSKEIALGKVQAVVSNKQIMLELLNRHTEPFIIPISRSKSKNYETLTLALEPRAFKGTRFPVRAKTSYTEGSQIYVPQEFWAVAAVGLMRFAQNLTWSESKKRTGPWKHLTIIPLPDTKGVDVSNAGDIASSVASDFTNRASVNTCLAHNAVRLLIVLIQRKTGQDPFVSSFASLFFSSAKGARKYKPLGSGCFPLEFLNNVADANPKIALELFKAWDEVFRVGTLVDYEPLAMALADFIARPSFETYERYVRIHLSTKVEEKKWWGRVKDLSERVLWLNPKTKGLTYPQSLIEEVTRYVNLN